jgi:hypothetical protein
MLQSRPFLRYIVEAMPNTRRLICQRKLLQIKVRRSLRSDAIPQSSWMRRDGCRRIQGRTYLAIYLGTGVNFSFSLQFLIPLIPLIILINILRTDSIKMIFSQLLILIMVVRWEETMLMHGDGKFMLSYVNIVLWAMRGPGPGPKGTSK